MSPYEGKDTKLSIVYRAHRYPYEWVPQVASPKEIAMPRLENSKFRVPGSPPEKLPKVTKVKGKRQPQVKLEKALQARLERLGY